VDTESTPLHRVFEFVRNEAAAHGVVPTWSEIVGLVPERVLLDAGARHIQLRGFSTGMLLEHRVRDAVAGGEALSAFVGRVAAPVPTPGGGSVAALAGALGAALAGMVAGLTVGKKKYAAVEGEMNEVAVKASALRVRLAELVQLDAGSYEAVRAAYSLPKEPESAAAARDAAIRDALIVATQVPLDTATLSAQVAELATIVAERGNTNAASDAACAGLMAEAACKGATFNVRINVASYGPSDAELGARLLAEAEDAVQRASAAAARAHRAAEASIVSSASG
jgi:glutamate formiminotransferase/formiminotetrahydrofolate cyclodeaminase